MSRLAGLVLAAAVHLLPAGHRDRYRRELAAELYDLPASQRLQHSVRFLARIPALRSAVSTLVPAPVEGTVMTKPLRCILRIHTWRTVRNEDGEAYQACEHCSAERDRISIGGSPGNAGGSLFT